VQSGEQHQLATRRSKISPGRVTEGWSMDEQTLKWGNERLAPAPAGCLFILDELGPLELKHGVGLMNGMGLISDRHYPLACVVIRPALLSQALELWPWGQILHIPLEELPAENGH
jgi:hypothetical protein